MQPTTLPREHASAVAGELLQRGFEAWFVGGCVRDLVLGREPVDFDISTNATPDQVIEVFPRSQLVGAQFCVVLVQGVEVATFRSDHAYEDGRHPGRIRFETDVNQDVLRRDFTVNALLLDPRRLDDPAGHIVDFVGGLDDLRAHLIRAIGDAERRFEEDHLRMLRAVRFAARLGFAIEPATMSAIQKLRFKVARVSPERVREEIVRILTEGGAKRGFELLDRSGLLEIVLPEVAALQGVEQPPEFHPEGDVWTHTLMMLDGLPANASATLAMGVLLHDVGKPSTFRIAERIRFDGHVEAGEKIACEILKRLRFSNEEIAQTIALIANHMRFKDVFQMRESTLKRFLRLPHFDEHLELHRLDCLASHGNLTNYEFMQQKRQELPAIQLRPARLLTGDDLIAAGYRPGPQFASMLETVEDAQLERRIRTRSEALDLLRARFGPPPV
jgi:tRNA nucleotidyltransferase/poly(A) polymerase